MLTRTRSTLVPAVLLGLALGVAGCGTDDEPKDVKESAKPSPTSTTASPAPYLSVPEGVTLTEPGTQLALGEEGVVAFKRTQQQVGALALTVERIERTSFQASFPGWNVDDVTAARTPYFVRVSITNVGATNLGGLRLDNVLWADDGSTLEAPNYYTKDQLKVCAGDPLPTGFVTGMTAELCQVFFIAPAHTLESITFRPPAGLDAITWTGDLSEVKQPGKGDKKSDKGDRKSDEKSGDDTAEETPSEGTQ